jgi:hypothetical protein
MSVKLGLRTPWLSRLRSDERFSPHAWRALNGRAALRPQALARFDTRGEPVLRL